MQLGKEQVISMFVGQNLVMFTVCKTCADVASKDGGEPFIQCFFASVVCLWMYLLCVCAMNLLPVYCYPMFRALTRAVACFSA